MLITAVTYVNEWFNIDPLLLSYHSNSNTDPCCDSPQVIKAILMHGREIAVRERV